MAACLGTAGVIGSIASGAAGIFSTIRGFLPGGARKKKDIRIRNQNTYNNSNNRHRTSVETMNYFRNEYNTPTRGHCKECGGHRVDVEGVTGREELRVSSMPPMMQGLEGEVLPGD